MNAVMLAVAILVCGVWLLDHLTTVADETVPDESASRTDAHFIAGEPRVFVFLVDSLRYETATDPARMPYLTSMRGTRARVTSSRDAVTVSAIREMFTGRERFLAFGFVKDFLTGRESVESIFTQLRVSGRSAAVYPPYAFVQFADDIPPRPVDETVTDRDQDQQDAWVREALAGFLAHDADLSVAHLVYSDRVAHDVGVDGKAYRDAYRRVDAIIRELDGAVPAEATLVVAGDHGHTDSGRHSLGLDVPTFALYRGAAFRQDVDLGTIPIAAHRYLMSWALELPLSSGYPSSRHPEGFAAGPRPPPAEYASSSVNEPQRAGSAWWTYLVVAMALGLIAGVWLGVVWEKWQRPWVCSLAAWLALGGLALMVLSNLTIGAAIGVLGLALVNERRLGTKLPELAWPVAGAGIGGLLHAWGLALAAYRDVIHEPTWLEMDRGAFGLMVITGGLAWRAGAARVAWWVVGAVGLLAHPTVYRYGTMPLLVTVWLAWLAAVAVSLLSRAQLDPLHPARNRGAVIALALGIALLIQPFAFADAGNFQMHSWHPWLESVTPHGFDEWLWAALVAKLVIFARWRVPHHLKPLGVVAAWVIHGLHWGRWHPSPLEYALLIVALTLAGALSPRWLDEDAGREVRRVTWLGALYCAYYYTIRIPNDHYMWADCFVAALSLSARLASRYEHARERAHHYAILAMFGVGVAGWVTLAWTLHGYEWKFLYELVDPGFAEEHALWFVPFINGRYLIPIAMVRLVIHEGFAYQTPYPKKLIWTAAGAKVISLALILGGIACAMSDSDVYLEGIQESAALSVFVAGLL